MIQKRKDTMMVKIFDGFDWSDWSPSIILNLKNLVGA